MAIETTRSSPTRSKASRSAAVAAYINRWLTGRMATDYSDASGTNAFDLNTFRWSEKLIGLAGLDGEKFPEALASTDILGTVTSRAAGETVLKEGTPVAVGGGDGSCAGVGVGCIRPGTAYNYLGSSSWVALTVEKPIVDSQMRTMNWAGPLRFGNRAIHSWKVRARSSGDSVSQRG